MYAYLLYIFYNTYEVYEYMCHIPYYILHYRRAKIEEAHTACRLSLLLINTDT